MEEDIPEDLKRLMMFAALDEETLEVYENENGETRVKGMFTVKSSHNNEVVRT